MFTRLSQHFQVALIALAGLISYQANADISASASFTECPGTIAVGSEVSCGVITLTSSADGEVLASPVYVAYGYPQHWMLSGNCFAGAMLNAGQSCSYSVTFRPTTPGASYLDFFVNSGSYFNLKVWGNNIAYLWQASAFTPATGCSSAVAQTRTVTCMKRRTTVGQTTSQVDESLCSEPANGSGPKPNISQTVELYNGCSYSWEAASFGACGGGSGQWISTDWAPLTGCGTVEQTRASSCAVIADSGSETRTVNCRRSDGTLVSDAPCDAATRPTSSQTCTPALATCGAEPVNSQSVELSNDCSEGDEQSGSTDVQRFIQEACAPILEVDDFCVVSPL